MTLPAVGLATSHLAPTAVTRCVRMALDVGYRAIDIAQVDGHEVAIASAITQSDVIREQLFLTLKLWVDNLSRDRLIPSLRESLSRLKTDYIDLALIHWPSPKGLVPLAEYMTALREAKDAGLVRSIGVANFTRALMRQTIAAIGAESIATNQIELNPYQANRGTVDLMHRHEIAVTAYSPLAKGKVLTDPVVLEIAHRMAITPAQVALAWTLQQGHSAVVTATCKEHLVENFAAHGIILAAKDMAALSGLDRGLRQTNPPGLAPAWD